MVRQLHELRNEKTKTFKILDFTTNKTEYIPKELSIRDFMKETMKNMSAEPLPNNRLNSSHHKINLNSQNNQTLNERPKKSEGVSKVRKKLEFKLEALDDWFCE